MMIKLCANRAWLAILADHITLLVLQIINAFYRADYRSRTTGSGFFKRRKFFFRNLTLFYLHTHILSQLHQTLVGDRRQNGSGFWCDISIILDTKEIGSTTLIDILLFFGVQIKLTGISQIVSHLIGTQTGSIITAYLIDTGSQRSGTVILTDNDIGICSKTTFEIRTYRSHKYHKKIFVGRMNTYLRTCTNQQRADIQSSPAFIRGNETFIQTNNLTNHLLKTFGRQFRHQNSTASTLQTGCILIHTEYTHLTIRTSVGLQSFKSFLSVMQTGSSHVDVDSSFRTHFNFSPRTVTIIATYVIVGRHIAEGQIRPVYFFHHFRFFVSYIMKTNLYKK